MFVFSFISRKGWALTQGLYHSRGCARLCRLSCSKDSGPCRGRSACKQPTRYPLALFFLSPFLDRLRPSPSFLLGCSVWAARLRGHTLKDVLTGRTTVGRVSIPEHRICLFFSSLFTYSFFEPLGWNLDFPRHLLISPKTAER